MDEPGSYDAETFSRAMNRIDSINENKIHSIVKVNCGFYINDNSGTREVSSIEEV